MKGILYYDSKYGSTKQVCQWIVSEINIGQITINHIKERMKHNVDYYIIGTPIFIGKPMASVIDFCHANKYYFKDKPLFLFITSWAESTIYRDECKKFLDMLKFHFKGHHLILVESLPGKLVMDKITSQDRKIMERLLRRLDNMSMEFQSKSILFSDQRSEKLSRNFGRRINEVLRDKSHLF